MNAIVTKLKTIPLKIFLIINLVIILVVAVITTAVYFYVKYQTNQSKINTPKTATAEETQDLITEVGKLVQVPGNETPTIATVFDKEKLKDQPFFALAANGDKVLIYREFKKAILYRPSTKKIIDIAPVNLAEGQSTSSASVQPQVAGTSTTPTPTKSVASKPIKLIIRNGTKTTGLARQFEETYVDKLSEASVVERGNAKGVSDYKTTMIYDVTGKNGEDAKSIATLLGITSDIMPAEEGPITNADFLIIVGLDKVTPTP